MAKYWLMKAEPDSRVVRGKDVKFSVDDFEAAKMTAWEGVRNYTARNLMKEMRVGDQVLFYHSNCKLPGVAGFAEVSRESFPDHTAWDESHPYFDEKTDKENPRWFMVEVTFVSRAPHLVPLSLVKRIAALQTDEPPEDVGYIGEEGVRAIKGMDLVRMGRLSVQRVEEPAWNAIKLLTDKGGFNDGAPKARKLKASTSTSTQIAKREPRGKKGRGRNVPEEAAPAESSDLTDLDESDPETPADRVTAINDTAAEAGDKASSSSGTDRNRGGAARALERKASVVAGADGGEASSASVPGATDSAPPDIPRRTTRARTKK